MNSNALIFLHISKTAGTTLRSIIKRQFKAEQIYDLDPSYFVADSESYDRVLKERVAKLKALSETQKAEFQCFLHPVGFGLHEILPQGTRYISMVRNPIDHFVSDYSFAVNKAGHIRHSEIITKGISLEAYPDYFPVDNFQTRRLSGCDSIDALYDVQALPAHALEQAKLNIKEKIVITGITEQFDESLLLMQREFSWKDISYHRQNVAAQRKKLQELSPSFRSRLESLLADDLELYAFAQKQLQLRISEIEPELWSKGLEHFHNQQKTHYLRRQIRGGFKNLVKRLMPPYNKEN